MEYDEKHTKGSTFWGEKFKMAPFLMVKVHRWGGNESVMSCAENRRDKKLEKSVKKRLTNEECSGNITKLSRETRVKTK